MTMKTMQDKVLAEISEMLRAHGLEPVSKYHSSGGLLWPTLISGNLGGFDGLTEVATVGYRFLDGTPDLYFFSAVVAGQKLPRAKSLPEFLDTLGKALNKARPRPVRRHPTHPLAMPAEEAITVALSYLSDKAGETDTASPEGHEVRCAIATLEAIRDQRGCEHFDPACEGRLVDLIDIIVFG